MPMQTKCGANVIDLFDKAFNNLEIMQILDNSNLQFLYAVRSLIGFLHVSK